MTRGVQKHNPTFPIRLDPLDRWKLDQLALKEKRSRGGLIKLWIDQEAKKAKIELPKEMTPEK